MQYTKSQNKADYDLCEPHFRKFVQEGGMGCPEIARKVGLKYPRVSTLFSIFIREYSIEKKKKSDWEDSDL